MTLIIEYTAPLLIEAFLYTLIVECATDIWLSNTPIGMHRMKPCSNALIMFVVVVFAASTTALVAYLVHCTYVFLVDALLRKTVMGISRGA